MVSALAVGFVSTLLAGAASGAVLIRRRRRSRRIYQQHLEAALSDGILTPEELGELEELRAQRDVSAGEARLAALAIYRRALQEAVADERITPAEEAHLARLQKQLELTGEDLAADHSQHQRLWLLARIERGELPDLPAPVLLSEGERCHWVVRATRCDRIALPSREPAPHGRRYKVGEVRPVFPGSDRDALESDSRLLPRDLGMLVVTSSRTLFRGARSRPVVPHERLRGIVLYRDGICLEAGEDHYYLVEDPELTAAALLESARADRGPHQGRRGASS